MRIPGIPVLHSLFPCQKDGSAKHALWQIRAVRSNFSGRPGSHLSQRRWKQAPPLRCSRAPRIPETSCLTRGSSKLAGSPLGLAQVDALRDPVLPFQINMEPHKRVLLGKMPKPREPGWLSKRTKTIHHFTRLYWKRPRSWFPFEPFGRNLLPQLRQTKSNCCLHSNLLAS